MPLYLVPANLIRGLRKGFNSLFARPQAPFLNLLVFLIVLKADIKRASSLDYQHMNLFVHLSIRNQ